MTKRLPDKTQLLKRRAITIQDLIAKADNEDWHGVADAAMDLREIDATLATLDALMVTTN